jgi:hypothetical protein
MEWHDAFDRLNFQEDLLRHDEVRAVAAFQTDTIIDERQVDLPGVGNRVRSISKQRQRSYALSSRPGPRQVCTRMARPMIRCVNPVS